MDLTLWTNEQLAYYVKDPRTTIHLIKDIRQEAIRRRDILLDELVGDTFYGEPECKCDARHLFNFGHETDCKAKG